MENAPVFNTSEEFRTWKMLNGRISPKSLDAISTKILGSEGSVHSAILLSLMDAKIRINDSIPVSTLESIAMRSRPQDCSPTIKAAELLIEKDEITSAAQILAKNSSKDIFHRCLAEAELYHGEGDRENAVTSAKKALDYDPSEKRLYEILEFDDPNGHWRDKWSVQAAYEGMEADVPNEPRLRELYSIYNLWFRGEKDQATEKLVNSDYYKNGNWDFILASARISVDEKDWRSARMMYDRIKDKAPFVKYEAAEAYIAGHDPEEALNIYDELNQTSIRSLQGRIAAYLNIGSDSDLLNAIFDYLDNEYIGINDYAECVTMLLETDRLEGAKRILDRMAISNKKDPAYLASYSKYLLAIGDVRTAKRVSKEAARRGNDDVSVKVLSARIRLLSEDIKGAEKECDKILQSEPDNREALILKKDILVAKNDVASALDVCRKILENDPADVTTMMTLSGAMNMQGDTSGSMLMLRKVLDIDPSRDNIISVVSSMIESGLYREAMFLCYNLEEELPPDPMLRRLRGNAEYCLGEYTKASVSYAAAAELTPHDPVIWHSKGMADEARGDLESAEAAYNRAVLLDLNESEYWISKATVQEKFDDLHGAIESLNRAIELDPGSVFPLVRKAVILERSKRYTEALYFVDLCLVMEPSNADVALLKARVLRESGSFDEAVRKAEEVNNAVHTEDSALELAACYSAYGRRSDAIKAIESALVKDSDSLRLRLALGTIEGTEEELIAEESGEDDAFSGDPESEATIAESMLSLGDYRAALRSIDHAISLAGEETRYLFIKVRILLEMGENNEAMDLVSEALRNEPKNAILHEAMGDVKMAKSEYRGALQEYEKAISLGLSISELLARKGDAQEKLGYYDRSIDSYTMAVNRSPEDRELRFRLANKLVDRGYSARAEIQIKTILDNDPDDVEAIILLAQVRKDSRKDAGVTEAYKMFRACTDVPEDLTERMIAVLESAGHDDEARSLKKKAPEPVSDMRIKRSVEKVLRRAYVSRTSPTDYDLIESLGFEGAEAEEIVDYITKEGRYGDIVPGSPEFQKMERASNEAILKLGWKDLDPYVDIPLEKMFGTGLYKDIDDAKRVIAYIKKALECDVKRDDTLKMVLDRVQGDSIFDVMKSCKVGVYQARQIRSLIGAQ